LCNKKDKQRCGRKNKKKKSKGEWATDFHEHQGNLQCKNNGGEKITK